MAGILKTVIETAKPNLATFVKYAKVELIPPTPGEISGISKGIKNVITSAKTGKWKQLTVREAWLNLLVATEVTCWFFIGECIGRRSFIGYKVNV
ncbi:ATP synthase F(0) complex subunit g, mitochondrial-like [Rhodnius prolixus]|uniref:ATP synthase subunit g n=2 Tax=Rhodnius TaxID=13248 RepID=R4G335_RHOPR